MADLAIVRSSVFQPFICPTCKCDIRNETMHGWVRDRNFGPETEWKTRILPCPTCSEHATARRKAAMVDRLFGQSHIPLRMRNWNFGSTPGDVDQTAIAACANFSNQQGSELGLYVYGEFGCGKTGLAISIIQAAMQRGEDAVFIRSLDLMDRLRSAIARGSEEGDDLLSLLKTVYWFALDDLATERPTDFVIEKLQAILEYRRDAGLLTIITSNFNYRELEAHWRSYRTANGEPVEIKAGAMHAGRRVIERIAEYCKAVPMHGRNLRRTAPDEGKIKPIRGGN